MNITSRKIAYPGILPLEGDWSSDAGEGYEYCGASWGDAVFFDPVVDLAFVHIVEVLLLTVVVAVDDCWSDVVVVTGGTEPDRYSHRDPL